MRKRVRKIYSLSVVFATFAGLLALNAQEKQNPNFTGGTVTKLDEGTKATIAHFRFEPGSRTKWHSHEGGQIILVEEGVAHTQVKGGPVIELKAGETTYGAAPDKSGVQYNVTRGGITWLEEVTDKEFRTAPKK